MIAAILISGLGESATSNGQGVAELATRLKEESGLIDVTRWGYWQAADAAKYAEAFESIALVGNSFGGDAAVEVARRLDRHCILFAVDPVPRSAWQRWTKTTIEVPANVGRAICLRRGRDLYPLAKSFSGKHVENISLENTDHNSVMRSVRTHQMIVDFILTLA